MTIICFRRTWLDYLRYHLATCTPYTVDRPMPLPKLQCDDTQGPTARRWNLIFTGVKASTVHIRSLEVCLRFYQTDLIMLWFQNTHSLYYASAIQQCPLCECDYVEITELKQDNRIVTRYCGYNPFFRYIPNGNALTVVFQSDGLIEAKGFNMTFSKVCFFAEWLLVLDFIDENLRTIETGDLGCPTQ
ncbi:hypothetical protein FBUS_02705 [Fasciolopsis buskii]|uniref:CUB domain-containing protein n=1 Tax=Fasciolopsis buskii TaxID=27845 RepID=A0A8E0S0B9_9TREM|nr:hypothetical protein FBUS_02705 [Fasciolopsis buski]